MNDIIANVTMPEEPSESSFQAHEISSSPISLTKPGLIIQTKLEAGTAPMAASIGMKARSADSRKIWYESFVGAHWSHKFQKFMDKIRTFDHRNDKYLEQVKDPDTGQTVHYCSEPLSEHVGHGSAKNKK